MSKLLFALFLFSTSSGSLLSQELTLYDRQGEAIAYVDFHEDATIFLWDGTPVAFLEEGGQERGVFGFNATFLGWYEDGVVYDKEGYMVGASENELAVMPKLEPIKGLPQLVPIQPITPLPPLQPLLKMSWSSLSLLEFLSDGKQ